MDLVKLLPEEFCTYVRLKFNRVFQPPPTANAVIALGQKLTNEWIHCRSTPEFLKMKEELQKEFDQKIDAIGPQIEKGQFELFPPDEECILMAEELPEGGSWPMRYAWGSGKWREREDSWPKRKAERIKEALKTLAKYSRKWVKLYESQSADNA
jgi:hypothetical protein